MKYLVYLTVCKPNGKIYIGVHQTSDPDVFDNYLATLLIRNKKIQLELWDMAGQQEFERIRPLSYKDTDVFIMMFSIEDSKSLDTIVQRYYPETQKYCPTAKYILVGSTNEGYNSDKMLKDEMNGKHWVTRDEAIEVAE